jgi:hypothetical protein
MILFEEADILNEHKYELKAFFATTFRNKTVNSGHYIPAATPKVKYNKSFS